MQSTCLIFSSLASWSNEHQGISEHQTLKKNHEKNIGEKKQTCKALKSSTSSSSAQKCKGKLPKGKCDRS